MHVLSQEEIDELLDGDEILSASSSKTPYTTKRKPTIDELVEEYAAKLDYLIAMRNLVKKNIKIDFYE